MRALIAKPNLRVIVVITIFSLCFLIPVIFLRGSPNHTGGPLQVEAVNYPLKLTMTLNKTEFKLGEPVKITIQLVNIGEENATITFTTRPNPNKYWFWRVYDENHQVVFYHEYVTRLPALEEITLDPGEYMQQISTWDQKATNSGQLVPPGTYYLEAATSFIYNGEEVHLQIQTRIEISTIDR